MKATIKSYYCTDSEDLSTYETGDPPLFGFTLNLAIGPIDSDGEDYFEVLVASAGYLAKRDSAQAPAFLQYVILAPDYNVFAAVSLMDKYISSLEEDSWQKLASKINRVAHWEYEDYQ